MPQSGPIIPAWLALLAGSVTLVALAGHLLALAGSTEMEPRRRRIRLTNAVLMMLVVPLVSYGFGVATPSHARSFVYVWVLTAALLFMIIFVAMIDMMHSWQMHRNKLRALRRQIATARGLEERAAEILAASGRGGQEKRDDGPRA